VDIVLQKINTEKIMETNMKKTGVLATVAQKLRIMTLYAGMMYQLLENLTFDKAQALLTEVGEKEVKKQLMEYFDIEIDIYAEIRTWWQNHYHLQHGMELDLSQVLIPSKPDGDDWILLCIAQGLTPNKEFNSWTFPKWKAQEDLDALAHKNQRYTTKTYFIWVKNGAEPDAEFLGKSTNQADPDMKIGMTLLERLVFQFYAHRIGLVLDKKGLTFCSGSRNAGGNVPRVYLYSDGKVSVLWYDADLCYSDYGVRRAVSA
jgi:hypothetical protein